MYIFLLFSCLFLWFQPETHHHPWKFVRVLGVQNSLNSGFIRIMNCPKYIQRLSYLVFLKSDNDHENGDSPLYSVFVLVRYLQADVANGNRKSASVRPKSRTLSFRIQYSLQLVGWFMWRMIMLHWLFRVVSNIAPVLIQPRCQGSTLTPQVAFQKLRPRLRQRKGKHLQMVKALAWLDRDVEGYVSSDVYRSHWKGNKGMIYIILYIYGLYI